jgi:hypothetical protein
VETLIVVAAYALPIVVILAMIFAFCSASYEGDACLGALVVSPIIVFLLFTCASHHGMPPEEVWTLVKRSLVFSLLLIAALVVLLASIFFVPEAIKGTVKEIEKRSAVSLQKKTAYFGKKVADIEKLEREAVHGGHLSVSHDVKTEGCLSKTTTHGHLSCVSS